MVLISKSEEGDSLRELADLKDKQGEIEDDLESIRNWVRTLPVDNEYEIAVSVSKKYNMNITQAKSSLESFPKEYIIKDKKIPVIVKDLKKFRRTLKGEEKAEFSKGIDNLIVAYSDHLTNCIKSIYWLSPYEVPLRQMRYTESDLRKMHSVKDVNSRRGIIDSLCKYWEADLHRGHNYNSEYSTLSKEMTNAKRNFRKCISDIPIHVIKKTVSEQLDDFVLKSVCENQGISARRIYDRLPHKLHRRSSPQIICKVADKLSITNIEGEYYKLPSEIKKDLYSYTAAFIDSDGYITMDRNYNPRIGMVATGNRGKAFVTELHKELGIGKLHLDQKSPQGTRLVNRLNFYSQGDITSLIEKCRSHFRMKGANADILTELIRIKKNHKKASWAKERMGELFKLMKWANHADHVNYDFASDDIDVTNISKYKDNCKMSIMDELETIAKSPQMTVMQIHQRMINEGGNPQPSLRVEERKPNEIQGTIEIDVDMQGDCCLQLKEAFMSEFKTDLDKDPNFKDSNYKLGDWNYQTWLTKYEEALSRESCEDIIETLENSEYFLRFKPMIDAYHSCNFGADSSAKYAMCS